MIVVSKRKQDDALKLQQLVHRQGIANVLLMLADIWRFSNKQRGATIYKALIEAHQKLVEAERVRPQTTAVQVSDGDQEKSADVSPALGG